MNTVDTIAADKAAKREWVDRINPIVIKECRQALKGKQFRNWFLTVLGICVLIAILSTQDLQTVDGTDIFPWYFGCIAILALVIVPRGAFTSISNELDEGTWDLIAISPLTTAAIVRGKLVGTFVQSLLFLSGIFPFLAFSYFMRGINLQMALVGVIALLGLSIVSSMLSIAIAAIAPSKRNRARVGTLLLMFLAYCAITSSVLVGFSLKLGFGPLIMMATDPKHFWGILATIILMTATYLHLLYHISVSCLSFPSANKSTAIRTSLTIQCVLWVGSFTYYFLNESIGNRGSEYILIALLPLFAQMFLVGTFTATESSQISRRVARKLPRNGIRGAVALFFYPGGFRGYLFFITMVIATGAAGIWLVDQSSSPLIGSIWTHPTAAPILLSASYLLIFISLPVAALLLFPKRTTPFMRRIIVFLTLALASIAPVFLFLLHDGRVTRNDEFRLLLTNPFYNIAISTEPWSGGFKASPPAIDDRVVGTLVTAAVLTVLTLIIFILKSRRRSAGRA